MNEAEKEEYATFSVDLCASTDLPLNKPPRFNSGYLFLQDIYYDLGFHKICRAISAGHSLKYDLNDVISRLVYTRLLFPVSKKSSSALAERRTSVIYYMTVPCPLYYLLYSFDCLLLP